MAIKRFQCEYSLLHWRAWQRQGVELGRGEELTGALRSWGEIGRAWQRRGAELGRGEVELGRGEEWSSAEVRSGLEPWGLGWRASGQAARDRTSNCDGRRRQGGHGGDWGEWRWQRILLVLVAVLFPLASASTSTDKAWYCEALASLQRWHIRILWLLSGVFYLLPWTSFLLHTVHGIRLNVNCQLWTLFDVTNIYWSQTGYITMNCFCLIKLSLGLRRVH
jgi:hypothetical protein